MDTTNNLKKFQAVGKMAQDTKGKGRFFLTIRIPFFPICELTAMPNENKTESAHPDFSLFLDGNKVGSLYKNEDKNGKLYFSGQVFCTASPTNFLSLFIFENAEKESWEIKIPYEIQK